MSIYCRLLRKTKANKLILKTVKIYIKKKTKKKNMHNMNRDTHKGSLGNLFQNSIFYKFQKNYLFLNNCENMVVSLLFTFLEHFKVVYPNMCWYVFMTSLDVITSLAKLLTLRNMRHVYFYAIVSSDPYMPY